MARKKKVRRPPVLRWQDRAAGGTDPDAGKEKKKDKRPEKVRI